MRGDIEDFKTGWYGVSLQLRPEDIDLLINYLQKLRRDADYHFHLFRNTDGGTGTGIADIEISAQRSTDGSNLAFGD